MGGPSYLLFQNRSSCHDHCSSAGPLPRPPLRQKTLILSLSITPYILSGVSYCWGRIWSHNFLTGCDGIIIRLIKNEGVRYQTLFIESTKKIVQNDWFRPSPAYWLVVRIFDVWFILFQGDFHDVSFRSNRFCLI